MFLYHGKKLGELDAEDLTHVMDRVLLGIIKSNVLSARRVNLNEERRSFLDRVIAEARRRELKSHYLTLLDPPLCALCGTGKGLLYVRGKVYCRKPLCAAMARRAQKLLKQHIDREKEKADREISAEQKQREQFFKSCDSRKRTRKFGR